MLSEWLEHSQRAGHTFGFTINDIDEKDGRDVEKIIEIFSKIIVDETVGYERAKKLAEKYGWEKIITSVIEPRLSRNLNMKKGKFGEMLESSILESFFDFTIPIKKWRYAISSDQSLPRCDIVAVKINNSKIIEMSFIESKLSTIQDKNKISNAYEQLMEEKESGFEEIISFIINRLIDEKNPLQEEFIEYCLIKDIPNDSYRVAATYDVSKWNEEALNNLNEAIPGSTSNLTVDVIRIGELEKTVQAIYEKRGWDVIE